MFSTALSFVDGNISHWDTSRLETMSYMFSGALAFDGDVSRWNTSRVVDMSFVFSNADSFQGDISAWDVSAVTTFSSMFQLSQFDGDLSSWNTSSAIDMREMFYKARSFSGNLSLWNTHKVKTMYRMVSPACFGTPCICCITTELEHSLRTRILSTAICQHGMFRASPTWPECFMEQRLITKVSVCGDHVFQSTLL
jgi:surface protein